MSLINDALKQAKATQPTKGASAEGPALRAVERERHSRGPGLLLPALTVVILLMAGALLWQWFAHKGSAELTVRARTAPEAVNVVPAPRPEPVAQAAAAPALAAAPISETAASPAVVPTSEKVEPVAGVEATAAVEPAKPEPPPSPYKLQSIFYNPKNPSAVISGKMVFTGDTVKGARVISIGKEAVSIITPTGETNVMELNF